MKNIIKITTAIFFFAFTFSTQMNAQSKQSTSGFSITFEGEIDLDFGSNFDVDFDVNLYNGLTKQLKKDGLIRSEDDYHFVLKNDEIKVGGKRLTGRDFHKYRDIIREDFEDIQNFEIEWEDGKLTKLKIKNN